jgi:DNA-binding Xre family transcriptional regulator
VRHRADSDRATIRGSLRRHASLGFPFGHRGFGCLRLGRTSPYLCVLFCLYNVRKIGCMNNRFLDVDGSKLKRLRRERAMSLRDLGDRSGIAFDTINRLELGKQDARPRTLRALAAALGVEPVELMKGEE